MRLLVCGGRDWLDRDTTFAHLDRLHAAHGVTLVIEGGAAGADGFGRDWAEQRGVPVETYAADWEALGRKAGPLRNELMLAEGRPDRVVAFPGGRGTSHMVAIARRAGVAVEKPVPWEEARPGYAL